MATRGGRARTLARESAYSKAVASLHTDLDAGGAGALGARAPADLDAPTRWHHHWSHDLRPRIPGARR
eukprot:10151327-Alexandrium_andersonii.AAC.1